MNVTVSGSFDDMRLNDFRFLDEASKRGDALTVRLWSDDLVVRETGKPPKFPYSEREYLLQSLRFVNQVVPADSNELPVTIRPGDIDLSGALPNAPACPVNPVSQQKKVVVTGCFDWFHSGHVRFFEEVSQLGDLYVVVGHDENIRMLKGEGHPLFPAEQRRYIAAAVRFVKLALISSGDGWMDAQPEFEKIRPDIYAVNEDGDRPEKRQFCREYGIDYVVLKREPRQGLPRRESRVLRGF
jgi:cytidyltransferase-like protein